MAVLLDAVLSHTLYHHCYLHALFCTQHRVFYLLWLGDTTNLCCYGIAGMFEMRICSFCVSLGFSLCLHLMPSYLKICFQLHCHDNQKLLRLLLPPLMFFPSLFPIFNHFPVSLIPPTYFSPPHSFLSPSIVLFFLLYFPFSSFSSCYFAFLFPPTSLTCFSPSTLNLPPTSLHVFNTQPSFSLSLLCYPPSLSPFPSYVTSPMSLYHFPFFH